MKGIILENFSTGYNNLPVLQDISLEINEPGVYVVVGKNGAGKTTLFRAIAGILDPYHGRLLINGKSPQNCPEVKMNISYLSHADATPEGFSVRETMNLFATIQGAGNEKVEHITKFLDITNLMDKNFQGLSQGQKKRVSLAKTLLLERDIYILDEPTSEIDPGTASIIRSTILELSKNHIVLYSSHNIQEAREIGRRIIAIKDGEISYFGDIESVMGTKYVMGIRADNVDKIFPNAIRSGAFFLIELDSHDQVQNVIDKLNGAGIRIKEIRQLNNPLEEFF